MAGRQAPRRTSLNWDESDTDEDKEEIDKVKAKLVHAKRQKRTGQSQLPNISAEHVADRTEGTVTSEVQQTHNMIVRLLPFALPRKICSCNADNVSLSGGQKVIFININGRYDLSVPLLTCENCHCQWTPQIKDLISNGYWPGTIEFQTVFSIDLFATYEDLKISAPGLSRHAFIRMLESRSVRAGRAPGRPSCGKSNFKAGREATRKSEARLDEEGMMTSVCRHCILFSGLNMFCGEIFAYPLYLQQDLGKEHKIEFVCTDVMCLTVGEEVEAVNSYLSRVATTTQYMSKARRTDMITIHARGWNLRKKQNLHRYLSQRYVKTKKRTDEMDKDIQNLQTKLQTTEEGMKQWVKEVEEWAASSPKSTNCQDQQGLQRVMEGLALKIKQRIIELRCSPTVSQDFPIWPWDSASTVPLETKKMAFDKVMLLSRLREEDGILIKEMKNHCRYLTGSSRAVQREIQQIEKDLCKQSCPFAMSLEAYKGLKDLLKKRLQEMEKQKEEAFSTYRNVLKDPTALQEEDNEGEEEVWDAEICLTLDDTDSSDDEKQD
ncbi:hypothetical protein KUCAC02_002299 [Chaenocephalus aceratus]|uniref:Uncharacterized protein n=1 Tax=Chaenocephalus aceratus TaxID=36190 RepID=A0ACB9XUK9_CHAAC|nr:hypothetical protein KUCAC02_002299 [Chaenocephalus aceratus]